MVGNFYDKIQIGDNILIDTEEDGLVETKVLNKIPPTGVSVTWGPPPLGGPETIHINMVKKLMPKQK